jgi:glycosyltransferase involved in cell wall biosynthesis
MRPAVRHAFPLARSSSRPQYGITVVIPVRNREFLISRAIQSVVDQTLPVDEIVVVDDASTDRTVDVVKRFANSLNNLRLISLKENVGAASARNIGLKNANGDLIAFLDSDDVFHPDKLCKQVTEFEANKDAVAVFCGLEVATPHAQHRHKYIPKSDVTQVDLYYSNLLWTMSCALISKKALLDIGGFDVSLPSCQDWDLFIRLSEYGKISVVQEELVDFWKHSGSRISNNRVGVLAGHKAVFNKIYARISDPRMKRKVRASHETRMADIFSGDFSEPFRAIVHLCRSLLLAPSFERWHRLFFAFKLWIRSLMQRAHTERRDRDKKRRASLLQRIAMHR